MEYEAVYDKEKCMEKIKKRINKSSDHKTKFNLLELYLKQTKEWYQIYIDDINKRSLEWAESLEVKLNEVLSNAAEYELAVNQDFYKITQMAIDKPEECLELLAEYNKLYRQQMALQNQ